MCVSSDVVHNSKSGQTKLGSSSRSTDACQICPPPNSVVVSQENSCTTNNACPTYEFMLLNVARLLLNMSRDKSKIKFIFDLCSNHTLFVALCETFLSDVISDSEIYISNFNPLRLLNVLKHIKSKSRSYYRTFPNVPENTTRHSVFSNLLRNPAHAHSIASIVIFDNRIKQLLKVVKNIDF